MELEVNNIFDNDLDEEEVVSIIEGNRENLVIVIPYSSLGFPRSQEDIMHDYLKASFCSEKVLKHAELLEHHRDFETDRFNPTLKLSIKPIDAQELAAELIEVSPLFAKVKDVEDEDLMSLLSWLEEFESSLESLELKLPDEIDDYYANYVHSESANSSDEDDSAEDDLDDDNDDEWPERQFGFWRSAASNTLGGDFYVSSDCWIIPNDVDYLKVLTHYSQLGNEVVMEDAILLRHNSISICISKISAINVNGLTNLQLAIDCAHKALFLSKMNMPLAVDQFKFKVSIFSDLLIMESDNFRIVYFNPPSVRREEIIAAKTGLHGQIEIVDQFLGLASDISIEWAKLSDEKFEELCYDIIYLNPRFDKARIQKMGKSKSRDGGRDIVAYTNPLPGMPAEKYIFQCKLITDNSSLSKSKLPEAANVIMEYGAKGYGIFTSTVIDSTTYDMLDGIERNQNVDTTIRRSVYELERFLAENHALKRRYFSA